MVPGGEGNNPNIERQLPSSSTGLGNNNKVWAIYLVEFAF